jgi:hypothetical protein
MGFLWEATAVMVRERLIVVGEEIEREQMMAEIENVEVCHCDVLKIKEIRKR